MIKQKNKLLTSFVLGTCLLAGNALGAVVFHDAFPGTTLDTDKWTQHSGTYSGSVVVADDIATMNVAGSNWSHHMRTVDEFNFQQSAYTFTANLLSHTVNWNPGDPPNNNATSELWFSVGPAGEANHARNNNNATSGFAFRLDVSPPWRNDPQVERLRLRDNHGLFADVELSATPNQVSFTLDATSFTITLDGGTANEITVAGTHSLPAYDNYHFMISQQSRGDTGLVVTEWDSVTIIPEPTTYAAVLGLLALGFIAYRRRMA